MESENTPLFLPYLSQMAEILLENYHDEQEDIDDSEHSKCNILTEQDLALIKSIKYHDELKDMECSICTENFNEDEDLAILPCNERHVFHRGCIQKWFEKKKSCPLCRWEQKTEKSNLFDTMPLNTPSEDIHSNLYQTLFTNSSNIPTELTEDAHVNFFYSLFTNRIIPNRSNIATEAIQATGTGGIGETIETSGTGGSESIEAPNSNFFETPLDISTEEIEPIEETDDPDSREETEELESMILLIMKTL